MKPVAGHPAVKFRISAFRDELPAWLFAAANFGYPIAGIIAVLSGVGSRAASVPFRLLIFALSVVVAVSGRWLRNMRIPVLCLLFFWACYIARLYHEMAYVHRAGADYALQLFLIACVAPGLALFVSSRHLNDQNTARAIFWVAGLSCVAFIAGEWGGLFGEASQTQVTGRLSIETVNPITIGFQGAASLLASLCLWQANSSPARRLGIMICMVAFGYCVVAAASKGPAIALLFAVLVWILKRRKLTPFSLLVICILAAGAFFANTTLLTRFSELRTNESTMERVALIDDSINQIMGNALIGSAYVELNSGSYPHNLYLEAALAIGVPMAVLLVVLTGHALVHAWRAIGHEGTIVGLLFMMAFVNAVTSASLFSGVTFWITMLILLNRSRWNRSSGRTSSDVAFSREP